MIEGVEKPGNVGAVMRSADGAGADAVIAASPRTDLFNPNAIRASSGTVFAVPLASGPTEEVVGWLSEHRLRVVAALVDAPNLYTEADLRGPIALVLGAEAAGLTAAWRGPDVEAVRLPMLGTADSLNVSVSAAVLLYEARRQRGLPSPDRRGTDAVDVFDFVIIGAGPGGEAAAFKARELGASVAIADRRWFGGELPAYRLPAVEVTPRRGSPTSRQRGGVQTGPRLRSSATTWSIVPPTPTNRTTAATGGDSRMPGPWRIGARRASVRRVAWPFATTRCSHDIRAKNIVVAVGSSSKVPPLDGIEAVPYWTNRDATLARELPASLLILGGGPTGCELAQVYVRFGVPTTIVQSGPRLAPTDHPRNSEVIRAALERDGVRVRTGVRAVRAHAGARPGDAHVIDLDDGSTAEGHAVLARGRTRLPARGPGARALRHRHHAVERRFP